MTKLRRSPNLPAIASWRHAQHASKPESEMSLVGESRGERRLRRCRAASEQNLGAVDPEHHEIDVRRRSEPGAELSQQRELRHARRQGGRLERRTTIGTATQVLAGIGHRAGPGSTPPLNWSGRWIRQLDRATSACMAPGDRTAAGHEVLRPSRRGRMAHAPTASIGLEVSFVALDDLDSLARVRAAEDLD